MNIQLINEHEAAVMLGLSVNFLRKNRQPGYSQTAQPIPFFRISKSIRYERGQLEQWLIDNHQVNSNQTKAG